MNQCEQESVFLPHPRDTRVAIIDLKIPGLSENDKNESPCVLCCSPCTVLIRTFPVAAWSCIDVLDRKFTWIKCKNVVKHNNNRPRGSRMWSSGTMGQVNGKSSALIHCNLSGLNYIPFLPRGYCMAPSPCGNSGNRGVHRILYVSFHLNCIGWQDLLSLCHCFL